MRGISTHSKEYRAVYGYNALKAILRNLYPTDPGMVLSELSRITGSYSGVLFLKSYAPIELRNEIKRSRLRVWDDRLTRALLGVCIKEGEVEAVGYSYPVSVDCLMRSQQSSEDVNERLEAMEFVDRNLIPAYLGKDTPYFITPVS